MPPPPYRRPPAGPGSDQAGRVMADLERLSVLAGAGDLAVAEGGGQRQLRDHRPDRVYARITGAAGGTGADYPWTQADESSATLAALSTDAVLPLAGTATSIPFREINGDAGVPVGTRVRGDLNASQDAYLFSIGTADATSCTEFDDLDRRDCLTAWLPAGGLGRCAGVAGGQRLCLIYDCTARGWVSAGTVTTDTGPWRFKLYPPACSASGVRTPLRAVLTSLGGSASAGVTVCGNPQGCRTVNGVKYAVFTFGGAAVCGGTRTPCGKNSFEIWVACQSCTDGTDPDNPCFVTVTCAGMPQRVNRRLRVTLTQGDCPDFDPAIQALMGVPRTFVYSDDSHVWEWTDGAITQTLNVLDVGGTCTVETSHLLGTSGGGGTGPVTTWHPFAATLSGEVDLGGGSSCFWSYTVEEIDPADDPCPDDEATGQWYCVQITDAVHSGTGSDLAVIPVGTDLCLLISDPDSFTGFTVADGDESYAYAATIINGGFESAELCDISCVGE